MKFYSFSWREISFWGEVVFQETANSLIAFLRITWRLIANITIRQKHTSSNSNGTYILVIYLSCFSIKRKRDEEVCPRRTAIRSWSWVQLLNKIRRFNSSTFFFFFFFWNFLLANEANMIIKKAPEKGSQEDSILREGFCKDLCWVVALNKIICSNVSKYKMVFPSFFFFLN